VKPVRRIEGRVAVLDRPDVDTDQIMPKQFLKLITRTGYGRYVFFDWAKDPDFELNRPECQGAKILIAGRNFGCGSSRENAAWGLQESGFEAIVAPSFGDIFRQNSLKIGLLPVRLDADVVRSLHGETELAIDLETCTVETPSGRSMPFELDAFSRHRLLNGLDEIGLTLRHEDEIAAFEAAHPVSG
jgi:3-isopropylmalate/(R)-2-methylmalate dehydratase small subunit